ncbi:unnamed protein product [Prunus armeniaca]
MTKLKHLINSKALTKPSNDQKPPPFTRGFVPNKPTQNKVYSFDLTKVDALFDEMLLQKAIETPHRLPKPEELKGRQLKLAEKPPSVTTDPFPQPQVNMVNLNWPEKNIGKLTTEASSSRGRRITKETNQRPKKQPTPSVFDRIGTSYQQGSVPALSKDIARQKDYLRPAQHGRRITEQPKK